MSLRFGTDGIRGVAGSELTAELAVALGRAAAITFASRQIVVGRDTRLSGPMLQAALSAGIASQGVDVVDLGVVPTPAVAAVCAARDAPGAVVSASHNPYADNGIKLFATGGRKLRSEQEAAVESLLGRLLADGLALPGEEPGPGRAVGRLLSDLDAADWYCERVVAAIEGRRLRGSRVVIDCANGAAWQTAPRILRSAGADVVEVLSASPDGRNINSGCGSTDPSGLVSAVVGAGADAGLALDGDADRVIAVDGRGNLVDGDALIALFALDLHERGLLSDDTVVVSVMSNLGLRRAMQAAGITVHETAVGDRHVLQALEANGWCLGGEQSGHLVFRTLATTGDGTLTGLLLLDLVARRARTLAELAGSAMVRMPQVLRNVAIREREGLAGAEAVWSEVRAVEGEFGAEGRVLLRPSGTERLVRIMVEAATHEAAEMAADRLATAVVAALGPGEAEAAQAAEPGSPAEPA